MRLSVFRQTLREVRRPLLHWTIAAAGVVWLVLLAHPLVRLISNGALTTQDLPTWLVLLAAGEPTVDALHSTAGAGLVDISTWFRLAGLGFFLPLLVTVFSVWQGSWLVAGEEERGSLGMLLAAPLQRYRLIFEKFAVLFVLVLGPSAGAWLSFSLAAWVGVLHYGGLFLLQAGLGLFWLGMVFGTLAMALGSYTGKRKLSQNLILACAIVALLAGRLPYGGLAFPIWRVLRLASPFYFYDQALLGFFASVIVLVVLVAGCLAAAWAAFEHRDLPV